MSELRKVPERYQRTVPFIHYVEAVREMQRYRAMAQRSYYLPLFVGFSVGFAVCGLLVTIVAVFA